MSLTELLLQARSRKAQQFLFVVGSEPRARVNSGWVSLRSSPGLITEWNLLQQSLLNNQQRAVLDTRGSVVGETLIEQLRLGFSFYQDDSTMKALLSLDSDNIRYDLPLPSSVLDTCLRTKGLVILSGPGDAGQTHTLHRLLQKMNEEKSFLGVVFSRQVFPQVREHKASFAYHTGSLQGEGLESLLAGADVVVFDGLAQEEDYCRALSLAERGFFVICSMSSATLGNTLRRWVSAVGQKHGSLGVSRLAETLSLCFGQYALPGLGGDTVYAHEVALMTPQMKAHLENQDIRALETQLRQAPDNSGLISLNQSLLQNLIRRKIDIKSAFEVSQDPDGLDHLLKKVGI
jgi:twitching motility protein PilT